MAFCEVIWVWGPGQPARGVTLIPERYAFHDVPTIPRMFAGTAASNATGKTSIHWVAAHIRLPGASRSLYVLDVSTPWVYHHAWGSLSGYAMHVQTPEALVAMRKLLPPTEWTREMTTYCTWYDRHTVVHTESIG